MKKAYSKPMLLCEDFRLSQSVAYGCTMMPGTSQTFRSASTCSYNYPGIGNLFYDTSKGCDEGNISLAPTYDCYNGPSEDFHLFAS